MMYLGISLLFSILCGASLLWWYRINSASRFLIVIAVLVGVGVYCVEYWVFGKSPIDAYRWQLAVILIIPIAYIDYKEEIIPNRLLLIGLIWIVPLYVAQVIVEPERFTTTLISGLGGAITAAGIFLIASFVMKGGVGAGDVKMHFVLGIILGFIGMFNVLLYSMIISALTGVVLIVLKKKRKNDVLPLAPFTSAGILLAIIIGV